MTLVYLVPRAALGSEPEHSPLGARLRARTAPLAPDDAVHGYAHAHLAEALSRPYGQLQEVFDPVDGEPFTPLLDPARCPDWALPWLAQLVGVTLPRRLPVADQRRTITELAPHRRGTVAMLRAAGQLHLTGTRTMFFRERDPSGGDDAPYTLEVVTLEGETPDPEAVRAALMAQKPGGIVLLYRTVVGWDYEEMWREGGTYAEQTASFDTYRDLRNREPIA